jgi:alkylated DNA nucleotide flippase Atl1
VPCHRVLAASQRLGGFSGGLAWKRRLLAREGVSVSQGVCPERRHLGRELDKEGGARIYDY